MDLTIDWTDEKNDLLNLLSDKMFINGLTDYEYLIYQYLQAQYDLSVYQESEGK